MLREAKNNITKFNKYVNDQLNTLSTRGESSNDILINLLTGYMACSDRKFTEYIENGKMSMKTVNTFAIRSHAKG
jgi:hypothetical protein